MKKVKEISYLGREHGDFDQEWLAHKGASEWWYATGIVNDETGALYTWQFTVTKASVSMVNPWIVCLAVTDFTTKEHKVFKKIEMSSKKFEVDETKFLYSDSIIVEKREKEMYIKCIADEFAFDLHLDYGKGPFWHCDDGFLLMGTPDTEDSTTYYSFTNMPTTGIITIGDKELHVTGKTWFDKQGGPYKITEAQTHWEWFSFRFFDDEEIMLFAFPQNHYQDGTYITDHSTRLMDYTLTPEKIIEADGMKFSSGWKLHMPGIKEEDYTITPMMEGQMQNMHFEELCDVKNSAGESVGYCFVELLPGVYNEKFDLKMMKA